MNTSFHITLAQEYEEINFSSVLFTLLLQDVTEDWLGYIVVRGVTNRHRIKGAYKTPKIA